jgi:hypothetical protein
MNMIQEVLDIIRNSKFEVTNNETKAEECERLATQGAGS